MKTLPLILAAALCATAHAQQYNRHAQQCDRADIERARWEMERQRQEIARQRQEIARIDHNQRKAKKDYEWYLDNPLPAPAKPKRVGSSPALERLPEVEDALKAIYDYEKARAARAWEGRR